MEKTSQVVVIKDQPKVTERLALKNCPFCGSKARIRTVNLYCDAGYRAQCTNCATGTAIVMPGQYLLYRGEHNKTFTDDEAAQEAARIWNERRES